MKKYSAVITMICILSILATPFPLKGQDGVYNTFSGLIWCTNPVACLHESAHKMDQNLGWISQGQKFKDAVKIFILSEARMKNPSPFLYKLFTYSDFSSSEIYANLYAWSGGEERNMPKIFQAFYDWSYSHQEGETWQK